MRCIALPSLSMLTRWTTGLNFLHSQSLGTGIADEIDISNRLIAFIDSLPVNKPTTANTQPKEETEPGTRSLKRLTEAIVAISSSLISSQLVAEHSGAFEG